jgi:putative serine protease PepD
VPEIIRTGKFQHATIGVAFDDSLQALLPQTVQGLVVSNVEPSSPAAAAGITAATQGLRGGFGRGMRILLGDVITQINDRPIRSGGDLFTALDHVKPGDAVTVTLWNNGVTRQVTVTTQ